MSNRNAVVSGVLRPSEASYGDALERRVATLFVGITTGVAAAMAMYVFRLQDLSMGWSTEPLMAGLVFLAGALVKLLVPEMRTSISAALLSIFVAAVALTAFQVAPYYLLGLDLVGGLVLVIPLGDMITLLFMFQAPLQFAGFLTAVVVHGMTG
jgi:hypothetical protein